MPSLIRCCGKVDGECGKEKGRGEEMEEVGEENERRRWRKRRREVEEGEEWRSIIIWTSVKTVKWYNLYAASINK